MFPTEEKGGGDKTQPGVREKRRRSEEEGKSEVGREASSPDLIT